MIPDSRVAAETMVKTGMVVIAGEVRTNTYVDLEDIVRNVITGIGYTSSDVGFDGASCAVINAIGKQSNDIASRRRRRRRKRTRGWRSGLDVWLRHVTKLKVLMPAPIHFAHID